MLTRLHSDYGFLLETEEYINPKIGIDSLQKNHVPFLL